jgi:hypothetical protein
MSEGAEELQDFLEARVAELYAGESIPVPRVEIVDDDYPAGGSSFGARREDGVLRLYPAASDLHGAIVDREAFLLGFSPKAKRNASIQHVASWLAFQRIDHPAGRAAF